MSKKVRKRRPYLMKDPLLKEKVIVYLNRGYSYRYISYLMGCSIESVCNLKFKLKKKGLFSGEVSKLEGINPFSRNLRYLRVFGRSENRDLVIGLLEDGVSYSEIGRRLNCKDYDVRSFHQKLIDRGVNFKDNRGLVLNIPLGKEKVKKEYFSNEKINLGKGSYKEYSKSYLIESNKKQKERTRKAKETLKKLKVDKLLGIKREEKILIFQDL